MTGEAKIRITQNGHTLTRFVRRTDGEWREEPVLSEKWREFDASRKSGDGTLHETGTQRPRSYGVGIVDLPNGQKLEVETQDWRWEDGPGPTTFAPPVHGRAWGDDGRTIRVVYRFPGGAPIGHDKLVPILNVQAANGDRRIELDELRKRLRNAGRR
jgi:hypothetical protein